jgi:hypothetical protein
LTQIATILGLYAEDSTPEFGALDTLSGLIDQNVTDATSPSIDIGGVLVNRNIGFDLGISRQISQIYIYTDRLSDPDEGWAIYTCTDNLEWTRLASGVSATFNSPLKRYEISLPITEARYFKAVNSGVNEEAQVLVTEIQAFLSSQAAQQGPQDMQNHRVTVNASYQLYHSVSVGCDVLYGSIPDNSLGNGRQDGSFSGNVTYRPSVKFSATTRYSRDFVNYLDNSIGSRGTETYSATFSSKPMETVDASLAASRTTNFDNGQESLDGAPAQRVEASLLRVTTVWLPAFSTISELGFTRDQRVPERVTIDSWLCGISSTVQLLRNLNATGSYRLQKYQSQARLSNYAYSIDRTESMGIGADYRATTTVSFRSTGRIDREGEQEEISQEHSFNWNVTSKISAYAEARWTDSNIGNDTFAFSLQSTYNPTHRTSLNLSYDFNRIGSAVTSESSSYRVGITSSF